MFPNWNQLNDTEKLNALRVAIENTNRRLDGMSGEINQALRERDEKIAGLAKRLEVLEG